MNIIYHLISCQKSIPSLILSFFDFPAGWHAVWRDVPSIFDKNMFFHPHIACFCKYWIMVAYFVDTVVPFWRNLKWSLSPFTDGSALEVQQVLWLLATNALLCFQWSQVTGIFDPTRSQLCFLAREVMTDFTNPNPGLLVSYTNEIVIAAFCGTDTHLKSENILCH